MKRCLIALLVALNGSPFLPAQDRRFEISLEFSRHSDNGDNPGTLFEVRNSDGQTIAGAGYLGAYNTFPRSDREELHVYLRQNDPETWKFEALPRIDSTATGFYPFQVAGEFYVSTRNGIDTRVHRWDHAANTWQLAPGILPGTERVAGKNFHVATNQVTCDGQIILKPDETYRFGEHYFANGLLILRSFRSEEMSPANLFHVFKWNPADSTPPHPVSKYTLELPQPREFVYTFAQWHSDILAVTNMGGVYRLRPDGWETLRTPIPTVSYQIYCGMNYRDTLLFGHYPTGELYEYAGNNLLLRKDWPPILPGVSSRAREAQTLALYNGELYCGVWPWGELWRYDGSDWKFSRRLFTHPPLTDQVTHPYETETQAVDKVYNLWGQRVTGLIPSRGSLYITTSSKGGTPWDPKFNFLSPEQQRDYGAIYRATLPGQASFHLPPSTTPTRFSAVVEGMTLQISINGETKASLPLTTESLFDLSAGEVTFADGLYGPSPLKIEARHHTVSASPR